MSDRADHPKVENVQARNFDEIMRENLLEITNCAFQSSSSYIHSQRPRRSQEDIDHSEHAFSTDGSFYG